MQFIIIVNDYFIVNTVVYKWAILVDKAIKFKAVNIFEFTIKWFDIESVTIQIFSKGHQECQLRMP